MQVELSFTQEEELKKQIREEIYEDIEKQKTVRYYVFKILWATVMFSGMVGAVFFLGRFESPERDEFYKCWTKNDVAGIDTKTGEELVKQHSVDCDRFHTTETTISMPN